MDPLASSIVGVGGLVVATASTLHLLIQSRGRRFGEGAKNLAELAKILSERGPLHSSESAPRAQIAHTELLEQLDLEIRANTVLYLDAVARMRKPGSYLLALAYLGYGSWMLLYALFSMTVPASISVDQISGLLISKGVIFVGGLILAGFGTLENRRRNATRRLRARMGIVDLVTVEGFALAGRRIESALTALLRRPSQGQS